VGFLYGVCEHKRPVFKGELIQGISTIHPENVGDEYIMTKGHFHAVLETGVVYYCLHGTGMMLTETLKGALSGQVVIVSPACGQSPVSYS
jgi:glucose-6-phosphate isomerase